MDPPLRASALVQVSDPENSATPVANLKPSHRSIAALDRSRWLESKARLEPPPALAYAPAMSEESFESLMRAGHSTAGTRRLRAGEVVTVPVLHVASDWVFVDVGTPSDGRIARSEIDARGAAPAVGDVIQATVVDPRPDGPVLAVAFGHGSSANDGSLELMKSSGAPVEAEVTKAVKAGVEVMIGSTRAFCPASHLELGRVEDLTPYVGRRLEFRVIEVRDGGRSVVVSR